MKVTVGVSGGIAAYKSAELVRVLQKQGCTVQVAMTASACRFVQPLTFAALTGKKVLTSLWTEPESVSEPESASELKTETESGFSATPAASSAASGLLSPIEHIEAALTTDLLVVAPATANLLARFAHGLADDFLTTLYLATTAPVLVAPAMNGNMWRHAATQANLALLRSRGVEVVAPGQGYLACGMTGEGRMAEVEQIARAVVARLFAAHDFAQETVLVTAGGTREALDPVRYLGNRSSGKMGYALAEAAHRRGARVILVSAPTALPVPVGCELVPATTTAEMRKAVLDHMKDATIVIKAAAVADYRPRSEATQKIKRRGPLTLELEPTEDILAEVAAHKRPNMLVIGFAAETEDLLAQGREKLARKGADAIVLNDVAREGVGFDSDRNAATFLTANRAIDLPEMSKRELADRILDEVLVLRRPRRVIAESGSGVAMPPKATP